MRATTSHQLNSELLVRTQLASSVLWEQDTLNNQTNTYTYLPLSAAQATSYTRVFQPRSPIPFIIKQGFRSTVVRDSVLPSTGAVNREASYPASEAPALLLTSWRSSHAKAAARSFNKKKHFQSMLPDSPCFKSLSACSRHIWIKFALCPLDIIKESK